MKRNLLFLIENKEANFLSLFLFSFKSVISFFFKLAYEIFVSVNCQTVLIYCSFHSYRDPAQIKRKINSLIPIFKPARDEREDSLTSWMIDIQALEKQSIYVWIHNLASSGLMLLHAHVNRHSNQLTLVLQSVQNRCFLR